ncbi:benzoyl-CoA-dihydrodiol lyase [Alcanivorax xiamenensis]|uniref:Benzoyl-CoA-dihydrodiol lyase n=1 Tax=Alcanivorax xiamenensis TaxID=1177156 RepID=A0ABQ6Y7B7_9GAMM|nr:2,3-epoxybenzoyl-CoA dihydrolase [Alcanivorax xiamenensis]KAF0805160.1 benzoyl-CoA-dihydrodiol lyase [Alcanivorax xiamenensis]
MIDFRTSPDQYRHWRLTIDGPIARVTMAVNENAGLFDGYQLKMNSYDLGVDIELNDLVQRLRFEHPEVKAVVLASANEKIFCAGANIRMLGGASHGHKVNFCKFTNETRNAIEEASAESGQTWMCAVNGTAAGGGYELALATDHIVLIDDGTTTVSLPEVSLLAVLPGTGGLTRVTDKRKVRRDRADIFCSMEDGVRGQRALDWRLVDELAPASQFDQAVTARAQELAQRSDRPDNASGVRFSPLDREISEHSIHYRHLTVELDNSRRTATLIVHGPQQDAPTSVADAQAQGDRFWPLALARDLDDAILHLRLNQPEMGTWLIKSQGDGPRIAAYECLLEQEHWLMREIRLFWKRTLKRLDVTSRTLFALVEPGSCFSGLLAELVFCADRSFMLDGQWEGDDTPPAALCLSAMNFGALPMSNGLTRLATRFHGEPHSVDQARELQGQPLDAMNALRSGLITEAYDDIDWDEELRLLIEERSSFSPDALIGMEANLRFAGPETMETRIFGRLTAWQNWIFQRPNAVGQQGALQLYGSGSRPTYNFERI